MPWNTGGKSDCRPRQPPFSQRRLVFDGEMRAPGGARCGERGRLGPGQDRESRGGAAHYSGKAPASACAVGAPRASMVGPDIALRSRGAQEPAVGPKNHSDGLERRIDLGRRVTTGRGGMRWLRGERSIPLFFVLQIAQMQIDRIAGNAQHFRNLGYGVLEPEDIPVVQDCYDFLVAIRGKDAAVGIDLLTGFYQRGFDQPRADPQRRRRPEKHD